MNIRIFTAPLAILYRAVVTLRTKLYEKGVLKSEALPGITISIGNIEVGGTGKSVVTLAVAEYLHGNQYRPVILTRGYGSGLKRGDSLALKGQEVLMPPITPGSYYFDEAKMQAVLLKEVPVVIGSDRVRAARRYLASFEPPTHWILDDGFSHHQIKRNLNLVLLDATSPFANERLLPQGRLREPIGSLARANYVFFTRSHQGTPEEVYIQYLNRFKLPYLRVRFDYAPLYQVSGERHRPAKVRQIALAAAIAKPVGLVARVNQLGFTIEKTLFKRDHCRFHHNELYELANSDGGVDGVITTEKDFWRDPKAFFHLDTPVYLLPIRAQIDKADLDRICADFC